MNNFYGSKEDIDLKIHEEEEDDLDYENFKQ